MLLTSTALVPCDLNLRNPSRCEAHLWTQILAIRSLLSSSVRYITVIQYTGIYISSTQASLSHTSLIETSLTQAVLIRTSVSDTSQIETSFCRLLYGFANFMSPNVNALLTLECSKSSPCTVRHANPPSHFTVGCFVFLFFIHMILPRCQR